MWQTVDHLKWSAQRDFLTIELFCCLQLKNVHKPETSSSIVLLSLTCGFNHSIKPDAITHASLITYTHITHTCNMCKCDKCGF